MKKKIIKLPFTYAGKQWKVVLTIEGDVSDILVHHSASHSSKGSINRNIEQVISANKKPHQPKE